MLARVVQIVWFVAMAATIALVWLAVAYLGPAVGPWLAGVTALLVIGLIHPALIAAHFVMSRMHGDPVPAEFGLSAWQALRMLDAEVDASMRGIWFATPFLSHRPTPQPAADATRSVGVLFVHGYFGNRANWLGFLDEAAARGYRCEAITLAGIARPIESHAGAIAAAIAALEARGATRVAIVAHSMGGLVVRAALRDIETRRVAHVITLGTPHGGTAAARFGRGANVVQMRVGGPWLAALALPDVPFTTVFSHHDDVVYPQTNARLAGAACIPLGGIGHVSLLYDRRVRTVVFDVLDRVDAMARSRPVDQATDEATDATAARASGS
jgi:triacylglycerol esterase/lipase EstA (alpha/beta hydrolase family)